MPSRRMMSGLIFGMTLARVAAIQAASPQFIEPNNKSGSSLAVVVADSPLVHTQQILPLDKQGKIVGADAAEQANAVLDQLAVIVREAGGSADLLVKLNVYVTSVQAAAEVEVTLARRFRDRSKPAASYVVTRLAAEGALVAMDAVAVGEPAPAVAVRTGAAVLPTGSRIYIAGQAEKGATLAEATRKTLESLRSTLQFLGRQESDIVQLKSFLSPMANVAEAQREMTAFFAARPLPPTVWVEWNSPLIEIELIAWGGGKKSGPPVEFLTPPGMTTSPVYSRVTRTNSDRLIYISGLYARQSTDAAGEVVDIFDQLSGALQPSGSDLRHLVKATYYCSTNDTSLKLNELRPNYYDPARPPSASKAMVSSVGRADRGLTIDMIAVPAGE